MSIFWTGSKERGILSGFPMKNSAVDSAPDGTLLVIDTDIQIVTTSGRVYRLNSNPYNLVLGILRHRFDSPVVRIHIRDFSHPHKPISISVSFHFSLMHMWSTSKHCFVVNIKVLLWLITCVIRLSSSVSSTNETTVQYECYQWSRDWNSQCTL